MSLTISMKTILRMTQVQGCKGNRLINRGVIPCWLAKHGNSETRTTADSDLYTCGDMTSCLHCSKHFTMSCRSRNCKDHATLPVFSYSETGITPWEPALKIIPNLHSASVGKLCFLYKISENLINT